LRVNRGLFALGLVAMLMAGCGPGGASAAAPAPAAAQTTSPRPSIVAIGGGQVQGGERDNDLVYFSIPYAAPPVGTLRWAPPKSVEPWSGVRAASVRGPACPQASQGWNQAEADNWSEDCLTLDVRTRSLDGKRPVMVWIHGGSNVAGGSSGPAESELTAQGVVVVGVQYRLGVLGFLSLPELSAEQGGSSGNYGLMDQIAALQWVHDNIAKFGGDPGNVTIYGESAGSQDVSLLLAAPAAQGLFHKAIMQSGTPGFGMSYRSLADAEKLGEVFASGAQAAGDLAKLRAMSPAALLTLQQQFGEAATRGGSFIFLRTTIDGKVLPDAPDALIARNAPKPVIIGTDKVEFGPADNNLDLDEFAHYWFGDDGASALAAYRAEQADPRRGHLSLRLESDAQFHCPTDRLADLLASHGWPVWRYEFDVGENGGLTSHAYELAWVFERKPLPGGVAMQDYWTALAVSRDPNGDAGRAAARPQWPRWDPAAPRQMAFGQQQTAVEPGKPRAPFCRFADNF
jgi:para-nitrobenzyl esterase